MLQQYVRALSPRMEFAIVLSFAFGYFILGSTLTFFTPASDSHISEAHLRFLIVYEMALLSLLGAFLSIRGWNAKLLGVLPTLKDSLTGIGLAIVAYMAYVAVWLVFGGLVPAAREVPDNLVASHLSGMTVVAASLINGVFEEVFVCGYIISAIRKSRSILLAINVSVAVRVAYHLYQGAFGVISIVPLGLVFAHWFARTGRLWPAITAHILFDLAALAPYVGEQS